MRGEDPGVDQRGEPRPERQRNAGGAASRGADRSRARSPAVSRGPSPSGVHTRRPGPRPVRRRRTGTWVQSVRGRAGGIGSANPDTTSHPRSAAIGSRGRAARVHVSVMASERRRHTTACGVRAGRWNSVPGSRSKVRHPGRGPLRAGRVLEFLRGASRHSRADGHGPPPLELEPERVDVPVVVEAHARPSRSLDEEQERALLASAPRERSEEGAPEADHEPHQARQDLVHLGEIGRLPGRQGGRETSRVARPVHAALRGNLEWEPAAGHLDAGGEAGGDGAPCPVARRKDRRHAAQGSPAKTGQRAVPGKPARERGHHRARRLEPARTHADRHLDRTIVSHDSGEARREQRAPR